MLKIVTKTKIYFPFILFLGETRERVLSSDVAELQVPKFLRSRKFKFLSSCFAFSSCFAYCATSCDASCTAFASFLAPRFLPLLVQFILTGLALRLSPHLAYILRHYSHRVSHCFLHCAASYLACVSFSCIFLVSRLNRLVRCFLCRILRRFLCRYFTPFLEPQFLRRFLRCFLHCILCRFFRCALSRTPHFPRSVADPEQVRTKGGWGSHGHYNFSLLR